MKDSLENMKKIIGCNELTHEQVHKYICSGWWNREMLPWEHCGMKFQRRCMPMSKIFLTTGDIHYCHYNDKIYYFGLGLKEPELTNDMLENGDWFVYTWAD
jgi:hypothetical protein